MKITHSLYRRISIVLLVVFLVMAGLLAWLFEQSSRSIQDETSQRLHLKLAEHLVHDLTIAEDGHLDKKSIKQAFHMMMVLGPSIELYIVDIEGNLLAYDAPEEKIKLRKIDTGPITAFTSGEPELPLRGDDPRSSIRQKIFSAALIKHNEKMIGYLYIIIGGEDYDSIATALQLSKAWQIGLFGMGAALLFLLAASLLLFYALTKPLRTLTLEITEFEQSGFTQCPPEPNNKNKTSSSEVSQLSTSFHHMARQIVELLERLQKLDQVRKEFLAYVSHDLRTPLTGTSAYLETLQLKFDTLDDVEKLDFISKSQANCSRLDSMINELFELARLDNGQVSLNQQVFSIEDSLSDLYSSLEGLANRKQIQLDVQCELSDPSTVGDIAKIERVIQNLVENAIHYTPSTGTVTIAACDKSGRIRIAISDTGQGIAENDLPYIFEPYYRSQNALKPYNKGTGLGLAICQRLLSLHHAELQVNSTVNKGTCFYFELEIADE
ncbi:hypothetical protein A9Q99_12015 [Gammaproteobacteria bacterium 45_16_T64]|nr:hypothetical protein A9Q99_12015 [Gammaproteobacteria bacterium 45_16_T64]